MKFIPGIIKDCINNKHPVKLRNGNKAYVFCDTRDYGLDFSRYVIRGSLTCGAEITWTEDGSYRLYGAYSDMDIIGKWAEPHVLDDMPVDHPILVGTDARGGLDIAHFLRVEASSKYPIVTVRDGKTSVTGGETERWASYQLLRARDLKGTPWEGSPYVREESM